MEIPTLPQAPADYGYLVTLLAALLSMGIVGIVVGLRYYLAYRDRRESEDKTYRDEQTKLQQAQWDRESTSRESYRLRHEQNTNEHFAELESEAKAHHAEIRAIIAEQQAQISDLGKKLDRLNWERESQNGQQKPPKEGGK